LRGADGITRGIRIGCDFARAVEVNVILFLIRYQRLELSCASLSNRSWQLKFD